jgi:hypothetical protein
VSSGTRGILPGKGKWLKEFDGETLLPFPHGEKSDEWLDEMNGRTSVVVRRRARLCMWPGHALRLKAHRRTELAPSTSAVVPRREYVRALSPKGAPRKGRAGSSAQHRYEKGSETCIGLALS